MYINTETLVEYSEQGIKELFRNTSFSTPFVPPVVYELVFSTPQPVHDPVSERVQLSTATLTDKGHYEQTWLILPRYEDYTDESDVFHSAESQLVAAIAADQQAKVQKIQSEIIAATQNRLDTFAKTRNYDGILSACTYATSSIPKFAAEGQDAVNARDTTWAALYTILAEVQSGTRPMPTEFNEIESELPETIWTTL